MENLISQYEGVVSVQQEVATDMDHYLQQNLDSYDFSFNLLPPTNRLIIPTINLDVPLVESSVVTYKDFTETSFDSDLEKETARRYAERICINNGDTLTGVFFVEDMQSAKDLFLSSIKSSIKGGATDAVSAVAAGTSSKSKETL